MILPVLEGFVLCFVLLLVCVVNIRNGAAGGVHYYEPPVRERVVRLGLLTKAEIARNRRLSALPLMSALVILAPLMAFGVNGAGELPGRLPAADGDVPRLRRVRPRLYRLVLGGAYEGLDHSGDGGPHALHS